ncbi:MAG: hypothetical protein KBH06_03230 [Spirochaetes bacterium]|nr:hypothetical protein [Spirochaetota bacterium]
MNIVLAGADMPISTEIFVMIVFAIGYPLFWNLIVRSKIKGKKYFIAAYTAILFSNIFTVLEEYYFAEIFNALEHISITIGSIFLLVAVVKFTGKEAIKDGDTSDVKKGGRQIL